MTNRTPHIHDTDAPGKARILDAGLHLFARNGLSATSIRDIAQATGLSNPALYKHFKTKHELAQVLFERLYRAHLLDLTKAVAQEADFSTKFHAFLAARLSAYDDHPAAARFTTDNLVTLWPQVAGDMQAQTLLSLLRDLLLLGRAEGEVTADTDISLQMALVTGLIEQLTRQIFFGALPGPASAQLNMTERLLRKAFA